MITQWQSLAGTYESKQAVSLSLAPLWLAARFISSPFPGHQSQVRLLLQLCLSPTPNPFLCSWEMEGATANEKKEAQRAGRHCSHVAGILQPLGLVCLSVIPSTTG